MTKDELIEAIKDFPGDMEVKVITYDPYSYDLFVTSDIDYIHKDDKFGKKIIVIRTD